MHQALPSDAPAASAADESRRSLAACVGEHKRCVGACLGLLSAVVIAVAVLYPSIALAPLPLDGDVEEHRPSPQPVTASSAWLGAPARRWQTARETDHRIAAVTDALFRPDFDFVGPVVHVSNISDQQVVGFGGAFTEASAVVFQKLGKEQQRELLDGYFSNQGLGFTLGRVHINSCEFSTENYNFDNTSGDYDLKHFEDAVQRDAKAVIPLITAARDVVIRSGRAPLRIVASPCSPPAWMKSNGHMDGSDTSCFAKDKRARAAWAKYFVRWITAFEKHGISIWAITVQSQPRQRGPGEACAMTEKEEAEFLDKYLGPALRKAYPDVKIFVHDGNKTYLKYMKDRVTSQHADGIAFQWYSGDSFETINLNHIAFPKAMLLASQASYEWKRMSKGTSLELGDWSFGEGYAHDIIGDLNAGTAGWIDWNLLLDEQGGPSHVGSACDAATMANVSKGGLYRHPQYYFTGHFSKFITPGSVRLKTTVGPTLQYRGEKSRPYGTCTAEDGLQATSFRRHDGLLVTTVLNCGDEPIKFKLQHGNRSAETDIPEHAIQTYLYEEAGNSPFRANASGAKPFVGVNLGGWLLLEDWMWASEMSSKGIEDEHSLIAKSGGPQDPRAISLMEAHWETFLTEGDLDRLQEFGITHVRVPIGYWLLDYDVRDGYVDGGERYLRRLLGWLQRRSMQAVLDLHAMPGAQTPQSSFTGRKMEEAFFFSVRSNFERGKRIVLGLAKLILAYESNPATSGVVLGLELINEPEGKYWNSHPGCREFYEEMVPKVRKLLPAERYSILLNFMESPRTEGPRWLQLMLATDPHNYQGVVYDAHVYHAYGDDDKPSAKWSEEMDMCKTCCRDPAVLQPVVAAGLPIIIGEYSLNTGFGNYPSFLKNYMAAQLSLWANTPGMIGSFFWNFKVLPDPRGWFNELNLVGLMPPEGPLLPVPDTDVSKLCPRKDLAQCPSFNPRTTRWTDNCYWNNKGGGS